MHHVLVLSFGEPVVGIEDRLWDAGFRSILRLDRMQDIALLTQEIALSLVVLVPGAMRYLTCERLCTLSEATGAPVVVVGHDPDKSLACLECSQDQAQGENGGPIVSVGAELACLPLAEAA